MFLRDAFYIRQSGLVLTDFQIQCSNKLKDFFLYKVDINLCTALWKLMCCPLDWCIIPQKHKANECSKVRPGLAIEFSS